MSNVRSESSKSSKSFLYTLFDYPIELNDFWIRNSLIQIKKDLENWIRELNLDQLNISEIRIKRVYENTITLSFHYQGIKIFLTVKKPSFLYEKTSCIEIVDNNYNGYFISNYFPDIKTFILDKCFDNHSVKIIEREDSNTIVQFQKCTVDNKIFFNPYIYFIQEKGENTKEGFISSRTEISFHYNNLNNKSVKFKFSIKHQELYEINFLSKLLLSMRLFESYYFLLGSEEIDEDAEEIIVIVKNSQFDKIETNIEYLFISNSDYKFRARIENIFNDEINL